MNFETARENMVQKQVKTCQIQNKSLLNTLQQIPREHFVPKCFLNLAYSDAEIPLMDNAHMLTPELTGQMVQALDLNKHKSILEVGTGSGYTTSLLASLSRTVDSIEISTAIYNFAKQNIEKMQLKNIKLNLADGLKEENSKNAFDGILLTGSLDHIPQFLKEKLKINGILVGVVGKAPAMQLKKIMRLDRDSYLESNLLETNLARLINSIEPNHFNF